MPDRIEDYALIGDCQTAALVSKSGSIDWLCLPRFDSPACFGALLGSEEHGRWRIAPRDDVTEVRRRYRGETLVLETEFTTDGGRVRLIDFMPPRSGQPDLVRIVEGVEGRVPMRMDLCLRFDYGTAVPWVRRTDHRLRATAGPDTVFVRSDVETHGENLHTAAEFTVAAGERKRFTMIWAPTHDASVDDADPERQLEETVRWWREWSGRCSYDGPWRDAVVRSLITLKAMTYAPTGGIVAAATTSLPEKLGGTRNWDYRICWLRDATFTLYALLLAGYSREAAAWRDWLVDAVAGSPAQAQIMYGLAGERRLVEQELPELPGYEGSSPVRIGNAAAKQLQLDVYGELMDALYAARRQGVEPNEYAWSLQRKMLAHLETVWTEPDEGIWEVRGPRRQFTHSKVMAWVAFDRGIRTVEEFDLDGDVDRWRRVRDEIHEQVCREGYDEELGAFVQVYGGREPDASLLMLPLVGFLPPDDPRVGGTLEFVRRELMTDGFVYRYRSDESLENLPPGEGAFLLCSFWMVDNLVLQGRRDEAREMLDRLVALRNDVGLLSEQVDPTDGRFLGNFPQAFSHVGLLNSAFNLQRGVDRPDRE